jgi:Protein of unknown function (DUF1097)
MGERMKGLLPLAVAVGILAFLWTWVALNFSFHWATSGDLGNGLHLPANFQLIVPAAFVSWAMYFAAGGDGDAAKNVAIANVFGAVGALIVMWLAPAIADLPDFWAIGVGVGVAAAALVVLGGLGSWFFIPGTFGAFASVFFWWIATGLDNWAPGGGGAENTLKALAKPATAGAGAFGGVISTPYGWVFVSTLATLTIGVGLGMLSTRLAALLTPKPRAVVAEAPPASRAVA